MSEISIATASTLTPTVALTGGIASGKSMVANEFAKLGIPIIDTDVIARQLVEPGQPTLQAIATRFGSAILDHGRLDRAQLRERIFNSAEEKQALESILHPAIRAEQQRQAQAAGGSYQIHVIPLLYETGSHHLYDRVIVVDCPRETQLQRLITRDHVSDELANRMLDAQTSREQRLTIADDVIDNTGNLEQLRGRVSALHQRYLKDLAKPA